MVGSKSNSSSSGSAILDLFRALYENPWLLGLTGVLNVVAAVGMIVVTAPTRETNNGAGAGWATIVLPDARISGNHSPDSLHAFYHHIGPDGCRLYTAICDWDIYPFCMAYTLAMGAALSAVARWNGRDERMAYLALVAGLADLVETVIYRNGCALLYNNSDNGIPERLPEWQAELAGTATQLKWIVLSLSLGSIVAGTIRLVQMKGSRK